MFDSIRVRVKVKVRSRTKISKANAHSRVEYRVWVVAGSEFHLGLVSRYRAQGFSSNSDKTSLGYNLCVGIES